MAIKKFYSNKQKPGWKENSSYVPAEKIAVGKTQKENQKKYYSWGYDIDLEPIAWDEKGNPLRNRKRESGFDSRKRAEAATGRIRLAEKNKKYELTDPKTFPPLKDLFQRRIKLITERAEKVRALRVLQKLLDLLAENDYPNLRVNELTTAMINLYVIARRDEEDPVKDSTINRDLRVIGATLNQINNIYSHLEEFRVPKVPYIKVDKTRREKVFQPLEVNAILFHLMKPPELEESYALFVSRFRIGLLFMLATITGARPGELFKLKEADVLYVINALKITGRKTRFRTARVVRYFPLVPEVRLIVEKAIQIKCSKDYIFSEKGTLTPTYYDAIKKACADADIIYGRNVIGGVIPYDLRHTGTTLLAQSGADTETISSLTGQSRHTLWHYTHASVESINRGAEVLQNFAQECFKNLDIGLRLDTKSKGQKLSLPKSINTN